MNGILLINKPQGFTSFDVIAKLRGILKTKRLGHAGTLDPMATGVLPVFVGKATKACDILVCNEKAYTASFRFGVQTDTQDITGSVLHECNTPVSKEQILNVIQDFTGVVSQIPPMYSAVSVGGKRLYDLARQGIEIERAPRNIEIKKLELLSYDDKTREGKFFILCSKGTYIRTIIHDIGNRLGVGGIMTALVRNSSSGFLLDQCYTIDEVQQKANENGISDIIIDIDKAFSDYAMIQLNDAQTKMYKNGIKLDINRIEIKSVTDKLRVYSAQGEFIGLAVTDFNKNELKVYKNFY